MALVQKIMKLFATASLLELCVINVEFFYWTSCIMIEIVAVEVMLCVMVVFVVLRVLLLLFYHLHFIFSGVRHLLVFDMH